VLAGSTLRIIATACVLTLANSSDCIDSRILSPVALGGRQMLRSTVCTKPTEELRRRVIPAVSVLVNVTGYAWYTFITVDALTAAITQTRCMLTM
jgi:hypothetical protein